MGRSRQVHCFDFGDKQWTRNRPGGRVDVDDVEFVRQQLHLDWDLSVLGQKWKLGALDERFDEFEELNNLGLPVWNFDAVGLKLVGFGFVPFEFQANVLRCALDRLNTLRLYLRLANQVLHAWLLAMNMHAAEGLSLLKFRLFFSLWPFEWSLSLVAISAPGAVQNWIIITRISSHLL